ncbi:MAG TPA: hypothetical protein VM219_04840 [Phycisphaerae bacterium]|nr:hypothetical protein [Phycisphaerae bacterium]
MAEIRTVNTLLWQDEYFKGLSNAEKLVYTYLMTNTSITYYGTIKAVPEMIAAEMGQPVKTVRAALDKFATDGKLARHEPYWIVVNYYPEHQGKRDGREAPELSSISRNALLSNKYEMPEPVLRQTLTNWGISAMSDLMVEKPEWVSDPPPNGGSNGGLNGGSNGGLHNKLIRNKKNEKKKRRKREKALPTPSSSLPTTDSLPPALLPIAEAVLASWKRDLGAKAPWPGDKQKWGLFQEACRQLLRLYPDDPAKAAGNAKGILRQYGEERDFENAVHLGNLATPAFVAYLTNWTAEQLSTRKRDELERRNIKAQEKRSASSRDDDPLDEPQQTREPWEEE